MQMREIVQGSQGQELGTRTVRKLQAANRLPNSSAKLLRGLSSR